MFLRHGALVLQHRHVSQLPFQLPSRPSSDQIPVSIIVYLSLFLNISQQATGTTSLTTSVAQVAAYRATNRPTRLCRCNIASPSTRQAALVGARDSISTQPLRQHQLGFSGNPFNLCGTSSTYEGWLPATGRRQLLLRSCVPRTRTHSLHQCLSNQSDYPMYHQFQCHKYPHPLYHQFQCPHGRRTTPLAHAAPPNSGSTFIFRRRHGHQDLPSGFESRHIGDKPAALVSNRSMLPYPPSSSPTTTTAQKQQTHDSIPYLETPRSILHRCCAGAHDGTARPVRPTQVMVRAHSSPSTSPGISYTRTIGRNSPTYRVCGSRTHDFGGTRCTCP
jgi:hypothetical protein